MRLVCLMPSALTTSTSRIPPFIRIIELRVLFLRSIRVYIEKGKLVLKKGFTSEININ